METKTGIVTRIIWQSDDSDRKIFLVRYDSPTGLIDGRMVADVRDVSPGDWFAASGDWRTETYRGQPQHIFSAKSFRPELPNSEDGSREFLSRIFTAGSHGITPPRIADFVRRHGADCCRKAEQKPDILLELSGDAAKYRDRIFTDWSRRISSRRAVVLMEGAGVDRIAISRIIDAFRDSTWETLRKNPYRVSRVPLVGFGNADKIGTVMNIPPNDRRRLDAAFTSLLDDAKTSGSTTLPAADLVSRAEAAFRFPALLTTTWLKDIAHRQDNAPLVVDKVGQAYVVQLPELFRAEAYIARAGMKMLSRAPRHRRSDVERCVDRLMREPEFSRFDEVQRHAIASSVLESMSILTGGPGTGKTTVTKAIAAAAELLGEAPIILAAPTGKAAKRMQEATGRPATTIHRMLWAEEDRRTGGSIFRVNRERPLPEGCFVIVDEASMLDVETMGAIFDAMPEDGRLLLVGDRYQLPSVGAGNVLSDLLRAGGDTHAVIPAVELERVYRQKGNSAIATGAAEIKTGNVPAMTSIVRDGLTMLENESHHIVDRISHLLRHGGFVREKLGLDPRRDVAILCPQAPGPAGTWEINRRLSAELNPDGLPIEGVQHGVDDDRRTPLPRIGDRVMMTENDDENDVMNGDVGTIVGSGETDDARRKRTIRIAFDCHADEARIVEYPVTSWRRLILAYACTVHKAQGSQWPCVILPMTMAHQNMLDRTLIYTGWTRAQDILLVVGEREAVTFAAETVRNGARATRLREFVERVAKEAGHEPTLRRTPLSEPSAHLSAEPAEEAEAENQPAPSLRAMSRIIPRPTGLPPVPRPAPAIG